MKYRYRVVYSGECIRVLRGGELEHNQYTNQPCAWCKTAKNAEKKFLDGIESLRKAGAKFTVTEYHVEEYVTA